METFEEIRLKYQGFSLRDVYLYHCNQMKLRPNTGLSQLLPTTTDQFSTLRELDVSNNYVGVTGFYPLLEVVYVSNRLETLILRGNGLTNDVVIPLCKIALLHSSLAVIDVSDNPRCSTPAGQALLKLAQRNPHIRRVCTTGTLIPNDIVHKIKTWTGKNSAAFKAKGEENRRTISFEEIFFDNLPASKAVKLQYPVRYVRMHESLRSEEVWGYKLLWTDTELATLTREEEDLLTKAFHTADTNSLGQLSHPELCQVFYNELGEVFINEEDAEFKKLFHRLDADEDGMVSLDEAKMVLRNYMTYEAVKIKNETIRILRDNFIVAAEGKRHINKKVLSNLLPLVDKKVTTRIVSDLDTVYQFGADPDELVEENAFIEAYLLNQAVADPVMASTIVHLKKPVGVTVKNTINRTDE